MIQTIGIILNIILELSKFILQQKKLGKIKDVHETMIAVKEAKTDEEKKLLAEKITAFWANP